MNGKFLAGLIVGAGILFSLGMTFAEGSHERILSPCTKFDVSIAAGTSVAVMTYKSGTRGTNLECGKKYRFVSTSAPTRMGTGTATSTNPYYPMDAPEEISFCLISSTSTSAYLVAVGTTSTVEFCEFGYGR